MTLQKNELLFARQSLVFSGAGKCSIMLDVEDVVSFESHLIRVRLNPEIANPMFYYYFSLPCNSVKTIVQQWHKRVFVAAIWKKLKFLVLILKFKYRLFGCVQVSETCSG